MKPNKIEGDKMIKTNGNLKRIYDKDGLKEAWSYNTCILTRLPDDTYVLNRTKYSITTTQQISKHIIRDIPSKFIEVTGLPYNVQPQDLIDAAVKDAMKF